MYHTDANRAFHRRFILDRQFRALLRQLSCVRGQSLVSAHSKQEQRTSCEPGEANTTFTESWPKVAPQLWRYIADRTGVMAYANLPLIWMFSGRNNIFIWLTGWQFGTFNLFHRHIARIATLQAIMHSVGYTAFYYTAGFGMSLVEFCTEAFC